MNVEWISVVDWEQFSARVSYTLLHVLWQGILIWGIAAIALRGLRNASANFRYWVACSALLTLPLLAIGTFTYVDVSIDLAENSSVSIQSDTVSAVVVKENVTLENAPERNSITLSTQATGSVGTDAASIESNSLIPLGVQRTRLLKPYFPAMSLMYFAGVVCMLLRLLIAVLRGSRLRSESTDVTDSSLLDSIGELAKQMGLKVAPAVYYCERVAVPAVIGVIKPAILLPTSLLTQLTTAELDAILRHELAHIRRFDLPVQLVQKIIESLFFFHPVVWWLSRQIDDERENCCDDLAAAAGAGNLGYAAALLRIAEVCLPRSQQLKNKNVAALSAGGTVTSQFTRRIERQLITEHKSVSTAGRSPLTTIAIALAAFTLLIGMFAFAKRDVSEPAGPNALVAFANDESNKQAKDYLRKGPAGALQVVVKSGETWNPTLTVPGARFVKDKQKADKANDKSTQMSNQELKSFVTIPATALPKQVRFVEASVVNDPEKIVSFGKFFGTEDEADLASVSACVTATFQEGIENKINVYGLRYTVMRSAYGRFNRLNGFKRDAGKTKNKTTILNGDVLLSIRRDHGVSDQALNAVADWFRMKGVDLRPAKEVREGNVTWRRSDGNTSVSIDNAHINHTDELLESLANQTDITELALSSTRNGIFDPSSESVPVMTNEGWRHLAKLKNLRVLKLPERCIPDDGLVHLKNLDSLRELWLDFAPLTDKGMVHLKDLTNLKVLRFHGAPITDEGMKNCQEMIHLEDLQLGHSLITDLSMPLLGKMKKLKTLDLRTKVTDKGLVHLKGLSELNWLCLSKTAVTDQSMELIGQLAKLEWLFLENTAVSDAGLAQLRNHSHLETLLLSGTKVTDQSFDVILTLKSLKYLKLNQTQISDVGIRKLHNHPTLERIELNETAATEQGIEMLLEANPQLKFTNRVKKNE